MRFSEPLVKIISEGAWRLTRWRPTGASPPPRRRCRAASAEPDGYVAFDAKDNVARLRIRRANDPARAPGYAYLLDILSDGSSYQLCPRLHLYGRRRARQEPPAGHRRARKRQRRLHPGIRFPPLAQAHGPQRALHRVDHHRDDGERAGFGGNRAERREKGALILEKGKRDGIMRHMTGVEYPSSSRLSAKFFDLYPCTERVERLPDFCLE